MKFISKTLLLLALSSVLASTAVSAVTVTSCATGGMVSLFSLSNGSLWGMGYNSEGQLGLGFGLSNYYTPQLIVSNGVTAVASGSYSSYFIKNNGSLWAMGDNFYGELGDGTFTTHYFPEQVATNVLAVAISASTTLIQSYRVAGSFPNQTITLTLSGMGNNGYGQLGDGTTSNRATPVTIYSEAYNYFPVTLGMATGYDDVYFIHSSGSLWGMGRNIYGELGVGNTNTYHSPVQIVSSGVVAVAAGLGFAIFLKSDGGLWAMGNNQYGQLGDNSTTERHVPEQVGVNVAAIAAGKYDSVFVKTDGSLWGMGYAFYGNLATLDDDYYKLPHLIVSNSVATVYESFLNTFFTKTDGSLWVVGSGYYGSLGDGYSGVNDEKIYVPEQVYPYISPKAVSSTPYLGTNLLVSTKLSTGGTYSLISSTNLSQPLNTWTAIQTVTLSNRSDSSHYFVVTNAFKPAAQRFYSVQTTTSLP